MRVYGNTIKVMTVISLLSLVFAFMIRGNINLAFYYDISMSVFGGAVLTLITSIVGYRVERRQAMETFSTYVKKHLNKINKAAKTASLEQKIDFYINFTDSELPDLGDAYSKINFLFDKCNKNRDYIFNKIYLPIQELENKINHYAPNFRWYKDGSGKNEKAMCQIVNEIEELLFEVKRYEYKENRKLITGESVNNKLVKSINEELNNRYYILMYGKKAYNEECKRIREQCK